MWVELARPPNHHASEESTKPRTSYVAKNIMHQL